MEIRQQVDVFIDGVGHYFEHISEGENELSISAPYLVANSQDGIGLDYSGAITISGTNSGFVFFTATRPLLKYILLSYGEGNFTREYLRDLVGEVANTIAGNARRHLGSNFHISTPRVTQGRIDVRMLKQETRSYVLPMRWRNHAAQLIVSLN